MVKKGQEATNMLLQNHTGPKDPIKTQSELRDLHGLLVSLKHKTNTSDPEIFVRCLPNLHAQYPNIHAAHIHASSN